MRPCARTGSTRCRRASRPACSKAPPRPICCIVGGGFTGLWAALHAKDDDPSRDVVVLEAETVGFGASGRNGGFAIGSLTHGLENGLARFADELPQLERLGHENFDGFVADLGRHGIDCRARADRRSRVALEPHELEWVEESAELLRRHGHDDEVFDGAAMRAEVASPTYLGGIWDSTGAALVDPGKLAAGLAQAALAAGVRIHERTAATTIERRRRRRPRAHAARARSAPGASCWRRAPTRRSCGRCAATSRRSTTTRS